MLRIRLGRTKTGGDVTLPLSSSGHLLLTGRTRTGKSTQLYGMLAQLRGQPVRVCGIDPSGIVFNALGNELGGDGWRAATLRDPTRVERVMADVVAEMDRRIDMLLHERRDKFSSFSSDMPLLIVVFEEFPGTLAALAAIDQANGAKTSSRIELHVRAAVQRLALEGSKVGVKLWVVAQRADAQILTGVLRSQLTTRLSFNQDADGLRMLHEEITPDQIQAAQRFEPGQAYAEIAGVLPLTYYRADYIGYDELVDLFDGYAAPRDSVKRKRGATPARHAPSLLPWGV